MDLQVNAEQSQEINCFELSLNREYFDFGESPCPIGSLVAFKEFTSQPVETIGIVVEAQYFRNSEWDYSILVGTEIIDDIHLSRIRILSKDHDYNIFNVNPPKFTIGDLVLGYIEYDKAWSDCSHGCLIVDGMKFSPVEDEYSKTIYQWVYHLCWYCEDGTSDDSAGTFEEDELLKITTSELPNTHLSTDRVWASGFIDNSLSTLRFIGLMSPRLSNNGVPSAIG